MMYIAAIFAILGCSHAFPSGAHNNGSNIMESMSSYCTSGNNRPNHADHLPQSTASPYTITVTSPAGTMYKHGQPVSITLAGTGGKKFKGFFLFGDATEASFSGDITCGSQGHNVSFCGKSGATHNNAVPKDQVICSWNPPNFQIGKVQFVATFVENFSTFWTGVKSSSNLVADPTAMTYAQRLQQLQMLMLQQFNGAGAFFGQTSGFSNMFSQGLTLVSHCSEILAFSDGSKLAQGFSATRSVYCHRSTNKRQPLHFNAQCNGYCEPNRQGDLYYDLEVSASSYWLDIITINITAKEDSERSVTGFSIYAVDETDKVAGSFIEDDDHILVGSCGNLLAYNQETHGAFHKMADHDRKNITFQFQPDGFNHGDIKFVVWVVNNHSDIHYLESPSLMPSKNGTYALDLKSVLHDMVSDVDINLFEDSFEYRKKLGYRLDLDDPFSLFESDPDAVELVPLNITDVNTTRKTTTATASSTNTTAKLETTTTTMYPTTAHQDNPFLDNVNLNGPNMNGANMNGVNLNGANNVGGNSGKVSARDVGLERNLVTGDVNGPVLDGWRDTPQQAVNPRFNVWI